MAHSFGSVPPALRGEPCMAHSFGSIPPACRRGLSNARVLVKFGLAISITHGCLRLASHIYQILQAGAQPLTGVLASADDGAWREPQQCRNLAVA